MKYKIQDQKKVNKITENFINMTSKEKSKAFIPNSKKRRICGTYRVANTKIEMLKR